MEFIAVVKILLFCAVLLIFVRPVGRYLYRVFECRERPLPGVFGPQERAMEFLGGADFSKEQSWSEYAGSMIAFSACSLLVTYFLLRCQQWLPLNEGNLPGLPPALAFNTAVSYATNTNWQAYAGETTMSLFAQMVGLTWHNFLSAAIGFCAFLVLARGLLRSYSPDQKRTVGNFWADLTRGLIYVFIPFCLVLSLIYVWTGVPQTFASRQTMTTLEGRTATLPLGPVASQEAIKNLGINGGGFFNANSAHPFENPTPFSNFLTMWAIFLIPAGSTYLFGLMAGNTKQGWCLLAAMLLIFLAGVGICVSAEANAPLWCTGLGVDGAAGNLEGKEVRFGAVDSAMFATVTTGASCGAVNSMHDSFSPIGGLVPLLMMHLGEIIFGGVGAGIYGIIVFAMLSVFVAGLMVGRTPEYLAKKIEVREMKIIMIYLLIFPTLVLLFSGWSSIAPYGVSSVLNKGPHGFSENLYAYSSAVGNNGSAFAGLNANTG
ncbi:MAG TPA: potassium-transporting ATPase subunit KdpA, partial [Candidatus Ozemobacteraceae bacterium]|nr:potassium-transporting ATPase subunit KdpA [Candidatus Ozemobacteraceae bacterium]